MQKTQNISQPIFRQKPEIPQTNSRKFGTYPDMASENQGFSKETDPLTHTHTHNYIKFLSPILKVMKNSGKTLSCGVPQEN